MNSATKTISDFQSADKFVEEILRDYPETRSSDIKLYFKACEMLGCSIVVPHIDLLFSPETITRSRRHIQNNTQKYLPTQKIRKRREIREETIHNYFGGRK